MPVDRPYAVPVPRPYPVAVEKHIAVPVDRPVPVPVPHAVPYPIVKQVIFTLDIKVGEPLAHTHLPTPTCSLKSSVFKKLRRCFEDSYSIGDLSKCFTLYNQFFLSIYIT